MIGSLAALPVLAIVTGLLGEADPVFGGAVQAVVDFVAADLVEHVLVAGFLAWIVAGWMRGSLAPLGPAPSGPLGVPRVALAALVPLLYALVALLTIYLALQVRALFGGAAFVEATAGLSYAEYARSGFFELVAVAMIVLAVLLAADALLDRSEASGERGLRVVSWALLALVGVLALSAVQRMTLYVRFFGLSEERIFALAGMLWIVLALGWFGRSVLRGRRDRFAVGLLVVTAAWIVSLNLLDPDALVARVNLDRARDGATFDVPYHVERSADAVLPLVSGAEALSAEECRTLMTQLHARWIGKADPERDWHSWDLPHARAMRLLAFPVEELERRYCAGS